MDEGGSIGRTTACRLGVAFTVALGAYLKLTPKSKRPIRVKGLGCGWTGVDSSGA